MNEVVMCHCFHMAAVTEYFGLLIGKGELKRSYMIATCTWLKLTFREPAKTPGNGLTSSMTNHENPCNDLN